MTAGHPTTGEQHLHSAATITRVDVMQTGARVLMYVSLATSALLLIYIAVGRPDGSLPIFAAALSCLNLGGTMAIGVGALHGHRGILAAQRSIQTQMARYDKQIEDRLRRLDKQIVRMQAVADRTLSAAADDLDAHRRTGRRN